MSFPDFLVLLCQRRFEEWDGVALNPIRVLFTDYDKDLSETIDSAGIFPKIKQGSMLLKITQNYCIGYRIMER
jgi:hypothetical protein